MLKKSISDWPASAAHDQALELLAGAPIVPPMSIHTRRQYIYAVRAATAETTITNGYLMLLLHSLEPAIISLDQTEDHRAMISHSPASCMRRRHYETPRPPAHSARRVPGPLRSAVWAGTTRFGSKRSPRIQ